MGVHDTNEDGYMVMWWEDGCEWVSEDILGIAICTELFVTLKKNHCDWLFGERGQNRNKNTGTMQNNVYRSADEMQGGHKYKKPDNKTRESMSSIVHCNQRTDSNIKCQNVLVSIMLAVCVLWSWESQELDHRIKELVSGNTS